MISRAGPISIFDSHCHLQDPRIANALPQLIDSARAAGVKWFAVNGTSEDDWGRVKRMGEECPSVIPCFGLHPWYVEGRSDAWIGTLRSLLDAVPAAAVGEAGLDKGARGSQVKFETQVEVFRQQLTLAKEFERPVSLHCVKAFGELYDTLKEMGPFPAGVILHSYLGSAEMVQPLTKCGAYFSFSGFLTTLSKTKAEKMLREVPLDRILLETDAPDALPKTDVSSLLWVPDDPQVPESVKTHNADCPVTIKKKNFPSNALNHPGNIKAVLSYISTILGMAEEAVASAAYKNAVKLFSYNGSKILVEQ